MMNSPDNFDLQEISIKTTKEGSRRWRDARYKFLESVLMGTDDPARYRLAAAALLEGAEVLEMMAKEIRLDAEAEIEKARRLERVP